MAFSFLDQLTDSNTLNWFARNDQVPPGLAGPILVVVPLITEEQPVGAADRAGDQQLEQEGITPGDAAEQGQQQQISQYFQASLPAGTAARSTST